MTRKIILTCEHAGNRVPAAYRSLFVDAGEVLASHRGWDPGSLSLAKAFERRLSAPLFISDVTRLLVEPNRSVNHRRLFSEFTAPLDEPAKERILEKYYRPHRNRVESWIAKRIDAGLGVLHVSLHTFTPRFDNQTRNADVGLLYDARRAWEKRFCLRWRAAINAACPELRVRRNYPYLGSADGFTTYLRRRFGERYAGIELEVNQRCVEQHLTWNQLRQQLAESFCEAVPSLTF